jgi:pyruvate-ferredoxin/flavodoxin oxidoreductase
MLANLRDGGVFVLNVPDSVDIDEFLPPAMRKRLADAHAQFYRIDASRIATEAGMPGRINMVMQTAFFGLANVMPQVKSIELMKKSIQKQYKRKGRDVIEKNWRMVDLSLTACHEVKYPADKWSALVPGETHNATGYDKILQLAVEQRADELTVDEFSAHGSMPPGTSNFEKRGIALQVPAWDSTKCIQCNTCAFLCPHGVIRPFLLTTAESAGLTTLPAPGKELQDYRFRLQISPYDCTGCSVCASSCPARALSMVPSGPLFARESENWEKCIAAPNRGSLVPPTTVRNSQFRRPLLEFSGACPGCGEPAIVKLVTQLYGDQLYIANAAGCSIVWAASYPWNPYTTNEHGHGPAFGFSLFEDNAEYGYGMFQAAMARRAMAYKGIERALKGSEIGPGLRDAMKKLIDVWDEFEASGAASRVVSAELKKIPNPSPELRDLISQSDCMAKKAVWLVGGDGWAYDIGYGGVDHVMASGDDVNILVLDTEVYSNTGGQCSKATQRGAIANFSAAGYEKKKKEIGAILMTYGNVYVASTCALANPGHALRCIREAADYNGPSIVVNYSPCISHGIKQGMKETPQHTKKLVKSGYVLLYRYDPRRRKEGKNPLQLDSPKPDFSLAPLVIGENRFASLVDLYPSEAEKKHPQLIEDLKERYEYYYKMAHGTV